MPDTRMLIEHAERLLNRLEEVLPVHRPTIDWTHRAYRWRPVQGVRQLQPVRHPHRVDVDDLLCMAEQKHEILRNTAQFVAGKAANNVLLWGSRGTGKSTLVKAVFNQFAEQGLRLVEVDKEHLVELPDIVELLFDREERFIVYCDDLSFAADEAGYKALKVVLEGSIAAPPENVLVYATSNRRHLIPEFNSENQAARIVDGELHDGEAADEKVSLSERFGLWLSFYPFDQQQYLTICDHWLSAFGCKSVSDEEVRVAALQWARLRGSRSGRVARQFALDQAGRS
jgi:predicted AAA+ superfamily ATPase